MVSGQQHAPATFYPQERPGNHCTGGWVGSRACLDGRKISSPPGFDPGPLSVATTTELPGPPLSLLGQLKSRQYDKYLKLITDTYCTFVTNFIINVILFGIIQHKTGMRTGSHKLWLHILKKIIHNPSACLLCHPTCYLFWKNSLRSGSELGTESQYSTQHSFSSWNIQWFSGISLTKFCWSSLGTTAVVVTEFDCLKQPVHKQRTSWSVQYK